MSSTNQMLDIFPFDETVSIEMSGAFYARITQLLMDHVNTKGHQEVAQIFEELTKREPKDAYEYHLITLSSLVKEVERQVQEQNKKQTIDVSTLIPDEDSNSDDPQSQSQPESQD